MENNFFWCHFFGKLHRWRDERENNDFWEILTPRAVRYITIARISDVGQDSAGNKYIEKKNHFDANYFLRLMIFDSDWLACFDYFFFITARFLLANIQKKLERSPNFQYFILKIIVVPISMTEWQNGKRAGMAAPHRTALSYWLFVMFTDAACNCRFTAVELQRFCISISATNSNYT